MNVDEPGMVFVKNVAKCTILLEVFMLLSPLRTMGGPCASRPNFGLKTGCESALGQSITPKAA